MRLAVAPMLVLLGASGAFATECPWLNTPTASGLLGGPAVLHYNGGAGSDSGVCEFTRPVGKATIDLRIEIDAGHATHATLVADPRLSGPHKEELRGIGNEAWAVQAAGGGELVLGRVRRTAFAIRARNSMDAPAAAAAARKAAELVAGNLF